MKYYVIEIAEGDASIAGRGVYAYDNETSAIASFHGRLGTAMRSEAYTSDLVFVISSEGTISRIEKFTRQETPSVEEE